MICRSHHHIGFRIQLGNFEAGIGNTGSGVPSAGFQQDLIIGEKRKLLFGDLVIFARGYHIDIFFRADPFKAFGGLLDQRTACT
ncbi:hypothetical protein FQZ97_947990 [compost metagenome]